jgi:hypothetical protein
MSENDEIWTALIPTGPPATEQELSQFFELYKLMVASSEALVTRRQAVNTFFLTINGILLTALGFFLKGGGHIRVLSGGVAVLATLGLLVSTVWRTLIKSFGQLNSGKFRVINRMEALLSASIFSAEWKALGEGKDPKIYRSFTEREAWIPVALIMVYALAFIIACSIWTGLWRFASKPVQRPPTPSASSSSP